MSQNDTRGYAQSSQVKWALWQWMQALAAFFFLGPLSFRADLTRPGPVDGDGSASGLAESLSRRRRLADADGGLGGEAGRVRLTGSEEGPGRVMEGGERRAGMADSEDGLTVRRGERDDMKWREKGEAVRAGSGDEDLYREKGGLYAPHEVSSSRHSRNRRSSAYLRIGGSATRLAPAPFSARGSSQYG